MRDHVLKVGLGENTSYHLVCNLDDTADCRRVCATHPEGCDPLEVEGECVRTVYIGGCVVAEWVNDGGIETVDFEHSLELPVTYQWNASHDYPSIHVLSAPVQRVTRECLTNHGLKRLRPTDPVMPSRHKTPFCPDCGESLTQEDAE
jgi:hypothetical protein